MIASQPSVETVSFYINGQWENAGNRQLMPVTNPATGAEIAQVAYATVEDVDRIESLTLEDFAIDFSKMQIPDREGRLSDGEMKVAIDTFMSSLTSAISLQPGS